MFDWIPIKSYAEIYYQVLLVFTILTFIHTLKFNLKDQVNQNFIQFAGFLLFAFVLLYMGTRPISGVFGDMGTYNRYFLDYASGARVKTEGDVLFHQFMKFCSGIMDNKTFFFVCASLYIVPAYVVSKKWFKIYWFYAFLMLVGSFSFWAYGTNGIRNGLATAFFLMALSADKKAFQIIWLLLSVNFHASMYLPAMGFVATWFYNQPKYFFYFWLASIPLSLLAGGFWESFFGGMVEDDRTAYFTEGNVNNDNFSSTGFRWDFLVYSATGVFAGWYYLFKKEIEDPKYLQIFNVYLFANAFWILVIRANFSNRFAYLSWFLLALVICYPLLKYYFEQKQHYKLGLIILAYFGFTYFMNVMVYG